MIRRFAFVLLLGACSPAGAPPDATEPDAGDAAPNDTGGADTDAPTDGSGDALLPDELTVTVLLDGVPAEGATVVQGGTAIHVSTDANGQARIRPRYDIDGEYLVVATAPTARTRSAAIVPGSNRVTVELTSYNPTDNPEYRFQDPGEPGRRSNTAQCGHCHESINDQWFASPHRTSASNPFVHDLYAGTAHRLTTEAACVEAGGQWRIARLPGGGEGGRCFVGTGVLQALNPGCTDGTCEGPDLNHGACADCHAPAINGELGGRDLLHAEGIAFDYGVSCDVCHRVDEVVPTAAPGVAGRLRLHRPSEPASIALGAGGFLPLTFGPNHDVPNPRMGVVQRDHFGEASFCAGCHQDHHAPRVPGAVIDRDRWPDGELPIQSTWAEWEASPLNPAAPCQSCHMPPDPTVANSANIERFPLAEIGVMGGWYRPPGSVAGHHWYGPRQPASRMLELALALDVNVARVEGELHVAATTRNVAGGHAVPTGEAMRNVLLTVEVMCDGSPVAATGGDVIPAFGGYVALRDRDNDWSVWPEALPGDVIRVIERTGAFHNYDGFGRFGVDGLSAEQKGMPVEQYAGQSVVISVLPDGTVELNNPLPDGDIAYLVRTDDGGEPLAGAPGWGFARVTVGSDGALNVASFAAVDIASDNRLLPQQEWTSNHRFADACDTPQVTAQLIYRNTMWSLAQQWHWPIAERVMAEVRR